jgi:WD40 repeat protein
MSDQPEQPAAPTADPKATHVAVQWKCDSPLMACRFDPTGQYLFAAAEDRTILRWTMADGKRVSLKGHESWSRGFAFTNNGETMLTVGYDGRLVWWNTFEDEPKPVRSIDAHAGWVRWVAVSPDDALIATGGNDNLVKLWTMAGEHVRDLPGAERHVYSTCFDPTGQHVLGGDLMGIVRQWRVDTGELVRTLEGGELTKFDPTFRAQYGGVRAMTFSPDGKHLACAGLYKCTNAFAGVNEPLVVVFNWETGEIEKSLHTGGVKGCAWDVAWHADGFVVAASGGGGGGLLHFWRLDDEKPFHKLKLPNTARGMDMHPDGLRVATAHFDSHVRISAMAAKGK